MVKLLVHNLYIRLYFLGIYFPEKMQGLLFLVYLQH